MEQPKSAREIQAALAQPFAPEDLEWRLQMTNEEKLWGIAVPYVTNRAIQTRLDEVVGPENWYNDYKPWHGTGKKEAQICGISIYFEGRGFITKWDGAEDSDIEPVKGGLSDSMKRSAVQWGIGRTLYSMDTVFVDIEKKGKSWVIKDSARGKLDRAYLDTLQKLGLVPAAAGGAQSQLTPKKVAEPPKTAQQPQAQGGENPAPAAPQAAQPEQKQDPKQASQQKTPATAAQQPAAPGARQKQPYLYKVCNSKVQGGMNSQSTHVVLEGPDGKRINAFVRGAHPELASGVTLAGVSLTMRRQDTVAFYVLEDYRIAEEQQAA